MKNSPRDENGYLIVDENSVTFYYITKIVAFVDQIDSKSVVDYPIIPKLQLI